MPGKSRQFRANTFSFLLPSVGNIVFVSIFWLLVFVSTSGLLADGDTGYHIKTGEIILRNWIVPSRDLYSFHSPPLPWTAHEWLSEVIMGTVFDWWGLTGIVVFFAFLLAFAHWLLYKHLKSKSDDFVLCVLVTLLATTTSSIHWLARPHVFSLLLIVIWAYSLDQFQSFGRKAFLFYLPLMMLFWVNLHAGFIMGLALVGIYLTRNAINTFTPNVELSQLSRCNVNALALTFAACLAVCLINPFGLDILLFPIRLTSNRFLMDNVIEFASPNFHQPLAFKYMFLMMIAGFALSRSALGFIDISLVMLLSYMSLYSARYIALFAVILAPVLLKVTGTIIDRLPESISIWYRTRNSNMMAIDQKLRGFVWPAMSVVFVLGLVMTGVLSYRFDEKKFPVKAVEFLKRQKIQGNLFNDDEFGDYMIFAAWPAYQVFTDGRSDMYGEKLGREYLRVANVQPGWKEILRKYDIRLIIFDTGSALTAALYEEKDWRSIYSDPVATIFIKENSKYASL